MSDYYEFRKHIDSNYVSGLSDRSPHASTWYKEKEKLVDIIYEKRNDGDYVIEIGSCRGLTSRFLGLACQYLNKKLICIDPWDENDGGHDGDSLKNYDMFIANNTDLLTGKITKFIRGYSNESHLSIEDSAISNCCLLFIDGCHEYPEPYNDLVNYKKFVSDKGIIAMHDVFDPGWGVHVCKSLDQLLDERDPSNSVQLEYFRYMPSQQEMDEYGHSESGLVYFEKFKMF